MAIDFKDVNGDFFSTKRYCSVGYGRNVINLPVWACKLRRETHLALDGCVTQPHSRTSTMSSVLLKGLEKAANNAPISNHIGLKPVTIHSYKDLYSAATKRGNFNFSTTYHGYRITGYH